MTLVSIPLGASVLVEANTFVYPFSPDPVLQPACQQLLERIARQELNGFTSAPIIMDVTHRLMTVEARAEFSWPAGGRVYGTVSGYRNGFVHRQRHHRQRH